MRIIPRAEWGARPPARTPARLALPTPNLWLHHTADELHGPQGVRATQNFHMDGRGWSDIAYHFLVDDDGAIYEGRGFGAVGAATLNNNTNSHAIAVMGNYDQRAPSAVVLGAIAWLIREGQRRGAWGELTGGHRDAPNSTGTACPGRFLEAELATIRSLTHRQENPAMPLDRNDAALIGFVVKACLDDLGIPDRLERIDNKTTTTKRLTRKIAAVLKVPKATITKVENTATDDEPDELATDAGRAVAAVVEALFPEPEPQPEPEADQVGPSIGRHAGAGNVPK